MRTLSSKLKKALSDFSLRAFFLKFANAYFFSSAVMVN